MENKWAFQVKMISDKEQPLKHKQPTTMETNEKKEDSNNSYFVRYSQETSFAGLKYIGESGNLLRR